ncbi:hypothetical protein Syun_025399 [Stephania yunnanensis]|uniref:Uncharacterized protein n=1 Tax=Stephania yunnanensis TaxID=152371 RepID=A0AAP0HUX9_9MAGN
MTTRKSQQGRRRLPHLQPQLNNINDDEFDTNSIDDIELEQHQTLLETRELEAFFVH